MASIVGLNPRGDDWLGDLLGPVAASVCRAYGVRCLHYAHAQAAWRYRLATWTNNNTYGTDRFHCLTSNLGSAIEARVPGAKVDRPVDEWGSPFLIEVNGSALHIWRYGETADDPDEQIPPPRSRWLVDQIFHGPARDQGVLEFPNLAPIPLARVAVLAYAGNRAEGLVRAFIGLPFLDDNGHVCWRRREVLDLDAGREIFGLPGVKDDDLPPRHTFPEGGGVFNTSAQPVLNLQLLDEDSGLDLGKLFVDPAHDDGGDASSETGDTR